MNKKIKKDKIVNKEIDSCAEQFAEILVALIDEKYSNKKEELPNKSDSDK